MRHWCSSIFTKPYEGPKNFQAHTLESELLTLFFIYVQTYRKYLPLFLPHGVQQ